jgi:hypothetical protein
LGAEGGSSAHGGLPIGCEVVASQSVKEGTTKKKELKLFEKMPMRVM